jgi:hypothetical protein
MEMKTTTKLGAVLILSVGGGRCRLREATNHVWEPRTWPRIRLPQSTPGCLRKTE